MESNTINPIASLPFFPSQSLPSEKNRFSRADSQAGPQNISSGNDRITLSEDGLNRSLKENNQSDEEKNVSSSFENAEFSGEEQKELMELKKRDTEVKAHEQAHLAAAGQYAAGGPSYTYQVGPDGKRYAIGGEVPIDMSKETTPEATIAKMQQVGRAALAPANPSSADRQIAARAAQLTLQARAELQSEMSDEIQTTTQSSTEDVSDTSIDDQISINGNQQENSGNIDQNTRQMILKAYISNSIE